MNRIHRITPSSPNRVPILHILISHCFSSHFRNRHSGSSGRPVVFTSRHPDCFQCGFIF
ncbi:hypothetical protein HanXRQr2_Chr11g0485131 [Helianthus annuus]|uniref:Uncharacterized protein n=1 Tax=Helianthus annuus TaxID=4232 RepID=A0A9K3HNN0_HELAN|nr:hypothetical protein HanXRQr2_Chr11g0485131 [Helianthus annuus]KAJ0874664.1 hypothetical protein HanPSC8_Chr11g0466891 [Helianthus annuus]